MRPLPLIAATLLLPLSSASVLPRRSSQQQRPLHPTFEILPIDMTSDEPSRQPAVTLADILGTQRALTTFASMARNSQSVDARLSDAKTNTTILAPLNSAIDRLPHKPWESPADYEGPRGADAYEGDEGKDRADRNLQRFVEAHLVTVSPWVEGKEKGTARTVEGEGKAKELWWETRDGGRKFIMPDDVEVEKVSNQVANGELWILKGVLKYLD